MGPGLDAEGVERYLAGLEPIGWRLGLERMRALCKLLGQPQRQYLTIHIVGTNGKTSVARMTEALLTDAGVKTGASVSPHLRRWIERVSVSGRRLAEEIFVAAANRVAEAASEVEGLTQFEVATAIAFQALADAEVEVAAIEAGLGGRLDASNVLESSLTVLTSVGLDHTDWLGDSVEEIAGEKLAVLRPGSALLLGPVGDSVRRLARELAAERDAELIELDEADLAGTEVATGREALAGPFRRIDLELARRASIFALDRVRPTDAERLRPVQERAYEVVADLDLPGRLELIEGDPAIIFDVAHNPAGAGALAEALPEITDGKPVIACLAVLTDKDHEGIASALVGHLDRVICTEIPSENLRGSGRPGAASRSAVELAEAFRHGGTGLEPDVVVEAEAALDRARRLAADLEGVVLVTGSHYLVALARDRIV